MASAHLVRFLQLDQSMPLYQRAVFWVLLLLGMLIPIIAVLAHRGFGATLFIPAIVCATSPVIWKIGVKRFLVRPFLGDPLVASTLAFLCVGIWVAVSSFWTPLEARASIALNVTLPVLSAGGVIWGLHHLDQKLTIRVGCFFAAGVGLALILLVFETLTGGQLRDWIPPDDQSWFRHKDMADLGRGSGAMVLMVFPAALIAHKIFNSWWPVVIMIAFSAISAIGLGITANALGLVAGIVAALLVWRFPRTGPQILMGLILAVIIVTPFVAVMIPAEFLNEKLVGILPVSWLQRFYVWEAVGERILSGLPFGHGVDYARWLTQDSPLVDIPGAFGPLPVIPTHPHNVFLQLWLETGLPGILLFVTAIWFGYRALMQLELYPSVLIAVAGVTGAVLVSFSIEASFWQVWRICVIGIAAYGVALGQRLIQVYEQDNA